MALQDDTTERFQEEVAHLLKLPPGAGDADVRGALLKKGGPDYLMWYDTRLQAIAESKQHTALLERPHRRIKVRRQDH